MKKAIFYCDIENTFTDSEDNITAEKRNSELATFADSLDKLCDQLEIEELLFSFISSNPIKDIVYRLKEFSPFVKNSKHLSFGTSFSDKQKIMGDDFDNVLDCKTTGKPFQIINNIKHIETDETYFLHDDDIKLIFFADDCAMQQMFLQQIIERKPNPEQVVGLVPGNEKTKELNDDSMCTSQRGILGTTNLVKSYIKKLKNKENIQDSQ